MQILLFSDSYKAKKFESFKDLFIELSADGHVILNLEDGIIQTNKDNLEYTIINNEGIKDKFIADVSGYRDELRNSFTLLQKQGIPMPAETINALKEQLSFIDS